MNIIPIKTVRVERDPENQLEDWVLDSLKKQQKALQDGDILVITSKIVSYFQGRVVPWDDGLIEHEADEVIVQRPWVTLTRKGGLYTANAGIDSSNVEEGYAVLLPEKPFETTQKIQRDLQERTALEKLGVIISDSICIPGRRGTIAAAYGYAGFQGVEELVGARDLYDNSLKYSALNIADSLATAANLLMGESDQSCPLAIIRNYDWEKAKKTKNDEIVISPSEDMYPIG